MPLPSEDFEIEDVEILRSLETANNSEIGIVSEIDLGCPNALYNMHKRLPAAPTKSTYDRNVMSEYQKGLLGQARNRRFTTPMSVQTFFTKKLHTVHYITL